MTRELNMSGVVTDDLPQTGSFEIIGTIRKPFTDAQSSEAGSSWPVFPQPLQRSLYADNSWHGRHGIGRFSAEVLRRIRSPHRYVASGFKPASPGDLLAPWRMRLGRSDVVFTPGFNAGISRARQVLTLHDLIHLVEQDETSTTKRAFYEHLVRPAVRRAGTVLTVSDVSRAAIQNWVRDDNVEVINVGNGCSDLFFLPTDVPRDVTHLLYVGNLKPHKNPTPIFAALARLPKLRLTVVTNDVSEAEGFALVFGVRDRIQVVESCTDRELQRLYAKSGALVVPSLREGFGLPAVEALAVGTPVVYWSGCESVAEVVGTHGTAVDDASDPDQWVQAITHTLSGQVAFLRPPDWQSRWSWDGVANRIDRAMQKVVLR